MRKINKGKEPAEWTAYRKTPDAQFEAKPELVDSLLKEQGYVCAFCMGRISKEPDKHKVAHLVSQKTCNGDGRELAYNNMVLACPGKTEGHSHCDESQQDADLTINFFSDNLNEAISYKRDGTICCSNPVWEKEMTAKKDGLNLNLPRLKENRKAVMEGIQNSLMSKKGWTHPQIKKKLDRWQNKDAEGKYQEYYGVAIWYLEKKLRQTK
ncbi:MAG: hypothetical protein LBL81_06530 [Tannerella sp.]|jgi:uncharacterized protein (TIGR02646 family)|nr:hypothetical protein [Tannerella sp.]